MGYLLLVHNQNHTRLTMLSLTAVEPHWSSDAHRHRNHRYHSSRILRCSHRLEAAEETSYVAVQCNRLTWLIESRLSNGVVSVCKLELDYIADRRSDSVWNEFKYRSIGSGADCDDVGFDIGG
jgi:hypothetical protein